MASRSDRDDYIPEPAANVDWEYSAYVAVGKALSPTLRYALDKLQLEIEEYRYLIAHVGGTKDQIDQMAHSVQLRVERCELIAAELRRRGEEAPWWE